MKAFMYILYTFTYDKAKFINLIILMKHSKDLLKTNKLAQL